MCGDGASPIWLSRCSLGCTSYAHGLLTVFSGGCLSPVYKKKDYIGQSYNEGEDAKGTLTSRRVGNDTIEVVV